MRGIGFMPGVWLVQALKDGLIPTPRAYVVASIIADAADADGRWCYLHQKTLLARCGGILGLSTAKRAITDLVSAGLVRKLRPSQVREFFRADIEAEKRWADRLPSVLELLIPAGVFPEQALQKVNQVREKLGEQPLTEQSRPYPWVGTTGHKRHDTKSQRPTNLSPTDLSPNNPGPSVRESAGTGHTPARETADGHGVGGGSGMRREPSGRALGLLACVPDAALRRPGPDRAALAQAVERLIGEGLEAVELTALLSGAETLRSPFPALMRRLRSVQEAREFLDGHLGAGVHHPGAHASSQVLGGIPMPRCGGDSADSGGEDVFARPPEFVTDVNGTASHTCPDHPGVRNVPGGTCRACGGPCRSVPGELLHPPAPAVAPAVPPEPEAGGSGPVPGPESGSSEPEPAEPGATDAEVDAQETDPALLALMHASLTPHRPDPESSSAPTGGSLTPAVKAAVKDVRRRLARLREENGGVRLRSDAFAGARSPAVPPLTGGSAPATPAGPSAGPLPSTDPRLKSMFTSRQYTGDSTGGHRPYEPMGPVFSNDFLR